MKITLKTFIKLTLINRSDWEEVTGIKVMILETETTTPEMSSSSFISQSSDMMLSESWPDTGTTRWSANDNTSTTSPSFDVYLTSEEPTTAGQDIKQYSDQSDDNKEPYKRLEAEQGGWKTKNSATAELNFNKSVATLFCVTMVMSLNFT